MARKKKGPEAPGEAPVIVAPGEAPATKARRRRVAQLFVSQLFEAGAAGSAQEPPLAKSPPPAGSTPIRLAESG